MNRKQKHGKCMHLRKLYTRRKYAHKLDFVLTASLIPTLIPIALLFVLAISVILPANSDFKRLICSWVDASLEGYSFRRFCILVVVRPFSRVERFNEYALLLVFIYWLSTVIFQSRRHTHKELNRYRLFWNATHQIPDNFELTGVWYTVSTSYAFFFPIFGTQLMDHACSMILINIDLVGNNFWLLFGFVWYGCPSLEATYHHL